MTNDGEPEAEPSVLAARGAVRLAEALEDPGHRRRLDPAASVPHRHTDDVPRGLDGDVYPPSRRRELERVRQEVAHDLLEPLRVRHDARVGLRVRIEDERHLFEVRDGRRGLDRRADDPPDPHRLELRAELAGDDARHVEDVVHQALLSLGVAADDGETVRYLRRVGAAREDVRPAEDRVERRAQLVGHDAEKLVLQSARLLGGRPCLLERAGRGALALERLLAGTLGELPLGDVDDGRPACRHLALVIDDGRADDLHVEVRLVLLPREPELGRHHLPALGAAPEVYEHRIGLVQLYEGAERLAHDARALRAELRRAGQVDLEDEPVRVDRHVPDRGEVEEVGVAAS